LVFSVFTVVSGLTDLSIVTLSCIAFLFVLPVMANKLHHRSTAISRVRGDSPLLCDELPIKSDKPFLRAKAECFARLCHRLGVRPSVCQSVLHTRELY